MADLDRVGTKVDNDEVNRINDMLNKDVGSGDSLFGKKDIKVSSIQKERVNFDMDLTEEEKMDALAWVKERRLQNAERKAKSIVATTKAGDVAKRGFSGFLSAILGLFSQVSNTILYLLFPSRLMRYLADMFRDGFDYSGKEVFSLSFLIAQTKYGMYQARQGRRSFTVSFLIAALYFVADLFFIGLFIVYAVTEPLVMLLGFVMVIGVVNSTFRID